MSDITPIEIPPLPQNFHELNKLVRELGTGAETSTEDAKIFTQMAQIACNYLEHQPTLSDQEIKEIHASLIKSCVQKIIELTKEQPFPEVAKELRGISTRFALLVCLPIAYQNLNQIPQKSSFVDTLLFCTLNEQTPLSSAPNSVRSFVQKYKSDPKVRETYDTFKNKVISLRDSWVQGVLGETIFFRLAQEAELNPQFSSPQKDVGAQHVDYYITCNDKKIPVQVKSCQEGNAIPTIQKDFKGRLLIKVNASPNWLIPSQEEKLKQALFPSPETVNTFFALVNEQLSYYHNP